MKRNQFCWMLLIIGLLLLSPELQAQWVLTNGPYGGSVRALAVSGTNLFAGIDGSGGVFRSTDNGASWSVSSLAEYYIIALVVSGSNIFAGTSSSGIFLSTNNGTSWTAVNSFAGSNVSAFAISGTNLFAGGYGVYLSTDNGANWNEVDNGLTNTSVNALAASGTNIFAGTYYGGVFRSTNNGASWTASSTGLPFNANINALAISGSNIFAGTENDGVYLSTDNGTSWKSIWSVGSSYWINAFALSGTNLFVGTFGWGAVFCSTNNGTSWKGVSTGLANKYVLSLAVSSTNLFAGTYDNGSSAGVWRRPLTELVTSVQQYSQDVPTAFSLNQNYPNPFNPSTTISFSLPRSEYAILKIFDLMGKEIKTLISKNLAAGNYSLKWDASNQPSGVYFYRLQAGQYADTKKLLLLK